MATSTIPVGNVGGKNQTSPTYTPPSRPMPMAVPGGSTPSSTNPYMIGGGMPGATSSGSVPSGSPALPTNFGYATGPAGTDPGQQQLLQKQFVDIAGKGTGGQLAQQYASMSGLDSAMFEQWKAGMAPTWQEQRNLVGQQLGAGGVSPNSTVAALGYADLGAKQAAEAGTVNEQLMLHGQEQQQNILTEMLKPSIQEVASSGWDVFGNVMNAISSVEGAALGAPKTFQKQGSPSGDFMDPQLSNLNMGAAPGPIDTAGVGGPDPGLAGVDLKGLFG